MYVVACIAICCLLSSGWWLVARSHSGLRHLSLAKSFSALARLTHRPPVACCTLGSHALTP
jgi:hypothetical protein